MQGSNQLIRVAIIGYGNIGRFTAEAVQSAPDMELAGVVRRSAADNPPELNGILVAESIEALGKVDVAILCAPSRSVPEVAEFYLNKGISTVDSYDIHTGVNELRTKLNKAAQQNHVAALISAGWDPGSDSVIRALLEVCAPKGVTYTNFGPGMSMGHTVAAKTVPGVKAALSVTIPLGTGIHRRMVYVELMDGADYGQVASAIKSDPYFAHDETHVVQTDDVSALLDSGHGVHIERKGVSGKTHNQLFSFDMKINNPPLTAQVLVSGARAVLRQQPGAYTMIEIPVIDYLYGNREDLIRRLV